MNPNRQSLYPGNYNRLDRFAKLYRKEINEVIKI